MSRTVGVLLAIIISLLSIEVMLRLTDPLGLIYWWDDINAYDRILETDAARGYVMTPGVHDFGGWRAIVNTDHERVVPASGAGCRVVFLGDSLTFGWGVNDDETFVNLLAAMLNIEAANTGTNGYNIWQISAVMRLYETDLFVWLAIDNDAEPTWNLPARQARTNYRFASEKYLSFVFQTGQPVNDWPRFRATAASLPDAHRLLIVAFDEPYASHLPQAHLIARYASAISAVDSHPDAAGHVEIASALLPILEESLQCQNQ